MESARDRSICWSMANVQKSAVVHVGVRFKSHFTSFGLVPTVCWGNFEKGSYDKARGESIVTMIVQHIEGPTYAFINYATMTTNFTPSFQIEIFLCLRLVAQNVTPRIFCSPCPLSNTVKDPPCLFCYQ